MAEHMPSAPGIGNRPTAPRAAQAWWDPVIPALADAYRAIRVGLAGQISPPDPGSPRWALAFRTCRGPRSRPDPMPSHAATR
jgi:hypothetical protein